MSVATIEYKNSPNESTAYAVSEGQKTKVQLVATPAGDLELADNPNVDTGYLVINGEKHKCALVAEVAGELKLPTSATDDSGYVTTQDGRQHKVKLVANIAGGGGATINNQNIDVIENGVYTADAGYTGLGTVNVNVPTGGGGQATKFGVSIDNFLGDVDENGAYVEPTEPFSVNLAGVKGVGAYAFSYKFYSLNNITNFTANEVLSIGDSAFERAFMSSKVKSASFDGIEEINAKSGFAGAFQYFSEALNVSFKKTKKINGDNCFERAFYNLSTTDIELDTVFPALEELGGLSVFAYIINAKNKTIRLSKLKKITGGAASYNSTFNGIMSHKYYLPSATDITGYAFHSSTTEIHFAAANQAAIEACDGYANKWGAAASCPIYFDL